MGLKTSLENHDYGLRAMIIAADYNWPVGVVCSKDLRVCVCVCVKEEAPNGTSVAPGLLLFLPF